MKKKIEFCWSKEANNLLNLLVQYYFFFKALIN